LSPIHFYFKIKALEEGGATALGPALTLCIGMASQCPKTEIIVCTDGMSNMGVGPLDSGTSEEKEEFYRNLGIEAKNCESFVSVIGFEGADCSMKNLSMCAELSR
jgi:Mg-chelatase subunit ChlD